MPYCGILYLDDKTKEASMNISSKYEQFEQDGKMVFVINEGEMVKSFAIPKSWGRVQLTGWTIVY